MIYTIAFCWCVQHWMPVGLWVCATICSERTQRNESTHIFNYTNATLCSFWCHRRRCCCCCIISLCWYDANHALRVICSLLSNCKRYTEPSYCPFAIRTHTHSHRIPSTLTLMEKEKNTLRLCTLKSNMSVFVSRCGLFLEYFCMLLPLLFWLISLTLSLTLSFSFFSSILSSLISNIHF